jgi:hypothetical protein
MVLRRQGDVQFHGRTVRPHDGPSNGVRPSFPAGHVPARRLIELPSEIVQRLGSQSGLRFGMNTKTGESARQIDRRPRCRELEPEVPVRRIPQARVQSAGVERRRPREHTGRHPHKILHQKSLDRNRRLKLLTGRKRARPWPEIASSGIDESTIMEQ